jgi:GxxExxY protein
VHTDILEKVASQIVDSAIKIHKALGPGLLENVYQLCFVHELNLRNIRVAQQVNIPIVYENLKIEHALRLDLVVEDLIIVELKAVEQLLPVHQAQLLTYLRLSNRKLGFLLNFNVPLMKHGIKRIIL